VLEFIDDEGVNVLESGDAQEQGIQMSREIQNTKLRCAIVSWQLHF
jgi:hypothetical protein